MVIQVAYLVPSCSVALGSSVESVCVVRATFQQEASRMKKVPHAPPYIHAMGPRVSAHFCHFSV